MEAVDRHLIGLINIKDYDVTNLFKSDQAVNKPTIQQLEARKRRIDSEKYYFEVSITLLDLYQIACCCPFFGDKSTAVIEKSAVTCIPWL